MKAKILSLILFLSAGVAYGAMDTAESPVHKPVGVPQSVAVSSFTWTKVTTVTAAAKPPYRAGAFITVPAGSDAACHGVFSSSNTTPSVATSFKVIEFPIGSTTFVPAGYDVDFYMVNQGTADQDVYVQEVRQ